jgi:hypothetical protein
MLNPTNQNFLSANAGLSNGNNPCFPMYLSAAPTAQTIYAPYGIVQVGQIAIWPANGAWICIGLLATVSGLTATWEQIVSASGDVLSVTGTANQILATPTTGNVVLSLIGPYTPATYTAHGVLIGEGTSSIVATATGSAGQYLVSNGASADPTFQTATPQLVVTPVAGTTQAMLSNHTYIAHSASKTTFTLPTTSAVGDIIGIVGSQLNTGGWAITYTTGQSISGPNESSTVTSGNLTSTAAYGQAVQIICTVANLTWVVIDNSGSFTVA